MEALHLVTSWPVEHVTAAVVTASGSETIGDTERVYRLASLTKPMVAWAVMVGVEEGIVALDAPLRFATAPDGVTLRHLLAHASGFGFDGDEPIAAPARRRIYSNTGIERAADELAEAAGMAFHDYLREAVWEPLGMASTTLCTSLIPDATDRAAPFGRYWPAESSRCHVFRSSFCPLSETRSPRSDSSSNSPR